MSVPGPTPEKSPRLAKQELRATMRARLATETPASALDAGRAVALRLTELHAWRRASRVGLFMSYGNEIDTSPVLRAIQDDGKELLLPRTTGDGRLQLVVVDSIEGLVRGRYGILEPPIEWPESCPGSEDLLCVPGLAFDRAGGRLGRGGGYYDRTFGAVRNVPDRPRLVGIGFSFQLVASVPMTELDVRVDGVVTDRDTVEDCGARAGWANRVGGRGSR